MKSCATCEVHAEAVFRVEGLDCRDEVVVLERRLRPLAGIEDLTPDLIGQKLHVKYDAAKLTTAAMVDAVGQAGMRMWLEHEEPIRAAQSDWRGRLSVLSGVSLALGAALSFTSYTDASVAAFLVSAASGVVYPARRAWVSLKSRALDINTLMVIAVLGALALRDVFEAASVVFLFAIAQWLEVRTMERARRAIGALMALTPREATVRRDGRSQQLPLEAVALGDVLLLRPGDKIPLDGTVEAGTSEVNEAPMTGESLPVAKGPGDPVYAGTINGHGALDVVVTAGMRDTRLARVIHLVETAQATRAPLQTFVERFAAVYTPVVVMLALALAVVPWLVGAAMPGLWVYRALVLLVIACPCALVVSTPVSFVAALSAAARQGVLVKGGASLERMAATTVVAFDKTGTLTRGELRVCDVLTAEGYQLEDVLSAAAAVEARSTHPVARAIVGHAQARGCEVRVSTSAVTTPGVGVEGMVDGQQVLVGGPRQRERHGVVPDSLASLFGTAASQGRLALLVSLGGTVAGAIVLEDELRPAARDATDALRRLGISRIVMLTGDSPEVATSVAARVGVDQVDAGLLPADKHAHVTALRQEGVVLMVGDGINDAPALAAADVGVAMGAIGSDVALEAADVALMSDELMKLPFALRLARATVRNVRTNVTISLVLKGGFLLLAIAGVATLWMAVLADTGATVIVVANALRLLRER